MRILIVEDDSETAAYIADGLRARGDWPEVATDGDTGLSLAQNKSFDAIVLDRLLPTLDGLEVLKSLRSSRVNTPVLFLTAVASIDDRVKGLDAGGDDYLAKPFAFTELYARLQSLTRRSVMNDTRLNLSLGGIEVDLLNRIVKRDGQQIALHPIEFKLLEYLMRNAGRTVTKTMLLEGVWQFNFDPKTNVVETHISRLRSKLDSGTGKEFIKTVRGSGYRFDA